MMYAPENQNSNERESAAQMDAEAKTMADYLREGSIRRQKATLGLEETDYDRYRACYGAAHWLALVIESMHSKSEHGREYAKEEIARLIELGKGE